MSRDGAKCCHCGKSFRVYLKSDPTMPARGIRFHYMDRAGLFCSQTCSTRYAVNAATAARRDRGIA